MSVFVFLELPGEIRNQIYQQLLIISPFSKHRLFGGPTLHPEILQACKQVHKEASQVLYGCNTFLAHSNLLAGLPRLSLNYDTIKTPSIIALIRRYHIRVRLDCDPNFTGASASDAFSGIEELTIEVIQAQFRSASYEVLRLFEEVRGVKRARIYGSVTSFPGYVEWLKNTIVTPKGQPVENFDEEKVAEANVKPYDLWTHGGR